MTTEKTYRIWVQANGIVIEEVEFDGDRHAFEIYADGRHVVTIYADSPEQTEDMRAGLNSGEDVRDWEDGNGQCVGTLISERTGDGLRETLRRLESEGMCYNDPTWHGRGGTVWVDEVTGVSDIFYEYETDDLDLLVDDLTDEELKNIIIAGL